MSGVHTAVLFREAVRASRRWQTYAMRFAFSAIAAFMIIELWDNVWDGQIDVARIAGRAREMFIVYVTLQAMAVTVLAPLLVALGIIEERDDQTLDLLTISALTPAQILVGKALSRLLVLVTVVLSALPMLSLLLTLGGIGVWEAINATVNAVVIALVLGGMGGFFALFAKRNPILSVVGALFYAPVATFFVPGCWILSTDSRGDEWLAVMSPYAAMYADGPIGLLPALAFLPVVGLLLSLALPVFRIITTDESTEEFGMLSPDVWVLERFKSRTYMMFVVGLMTMWAIPLSWESGLAKWLDVQLWGALMFVYGALWLYVLTSLWLIFVMWLSRSATQWFAGRAATDVARTQRTVWGNPVAWREIGTRSALGMRALVIGGTALWVFMALSAAAMEGLNDSEVRIFLFTGAIMGSVFVANLLATSTIVEERSGRTLPLLMTTRLTSASVVWGKLSGVLLRVTPVLLCAFVVFALFQPEYPWWRYTSGPGPVYLDELQVKSSELWPKARLLEGLWLGVWTFAAISAMSLGAMWIALRVNSARLAWVINLVWMLVYFTWPVLLAGTFYVVFGNDLDLEDLLELWLPFGRVAVHDPGTPHKLVFSALWHLTVAGVLFALLSRRFRSLATR